MRTFLALLLLAMTASAQPILKNAVTTNTLPNGLGVLTNNGTGGLGFSTNIAQSITISNLFTTNLTVFNSLTVSNIITTNITIQNNLTTSNLFYVSGKGNTLIITNSITLSNNLVSAVTVNGTNPAPLINLTNSGTVTWAQSGTNWTANATSSGTTVSVNGTNVTTPNLTNTATVTFAISGSNILATALGGDTTATNIVTVTQTGTNASQLDFSLVARGGVFKITLTNNCYFGVPANANNTDFKHCWLAVQQPSTGTCLVTFTNGVFAQPQGQVLINDTNASAVVYYEMVSSPFTNGVVEVWMSQRSARP